MKRLGERLLGDTGKFPFEQRIFHVAMLLAVALTIFGTVMDVYYRVDIRLDLVFLGAWILTYYLSRAKNWFHITSVVSMAVCVFGFVPYLWIDSGGISGVIPYYMVLFMAFVCIVIKGPYRIVMACSLTAVVLLLIVRDAVLAGSFSAAVQSNIRPNDFIFHLSALMVVCAALLIVYSNTYQREKERGEAYARRIEDHYRQQLFYMETLEQMIYRLKSERHDFNNHLGVIHGLLESGAEERARAYARQLVSAAQEYQTLVQAPYPMVRAMLNYKLSAFKETGVDLQLSVAMPEGLALDEFDAVVILGNLLDNAAEACGALPAEQRYLRLEIRYQPDYLVIQTENPALAGQAGGKGRSAKPDAENHGFGLGNIEYLAAKHNGFLQTGQEDGIFRANVAMLVPMQGQ